MQMQSAIQREIRAQANPKKARVLRGFFKTGKGEYGEGDQFLGLTVPISRRIARAHWDISLKEISQLLHSAFHEERLVAVLMLVHRFETEENNRKKIFDYYLANTKYINNWDLVDLSADKIVGAYLFKKSRALLLRLIQSGYLWERRIAMVSTFYFIKNGEDAETYRLAVRLLGDRHDLMHKATGWMLREAGKQVSQKRLIAFVWSHKDRMPRTMLRYAIERLPAKLRKKLMQ
jgi:3-methyladenine DNA glycosylase AlkD